MSDSTELAEVSSLRLSRDFCGLDLLLRYRFFAIALKVFDRRGGSAVD